jgi:hypothetical protein
MAVGVVTACLGYQSFAGPLAGALGGAWLMTESSHPSR